jgi:NADH-quinone oxidoreductase subunit G
LDNFNFETSESVRDDLLGADVTDCAKLLNNFAENCAITGTPNSPISTVGLERISDVPIYSTDAIVRRAESLQRTADAKALSVSLSSTEFAKLGIANGDYIKVTQADVSLVLAANLDKTLPANVVRVAAGVLATSQLGSMFGAIQVERA